MLDQNPPANGASVYTARQVGGASSTTLTVTYDPTAPSTTINQAASPAQADPANTLPIKFTVDFSESVSGFDASDVILSGTANTASAVKVITQNSLSNYTVSVSNITVSANTGETVTATIPQGAVTDAAGNLSAASTSTDNTVTYDPIAPTVTINQANTQSDPANSLPIRFTIVFSEPVSGFTVSGITLSGTAGMSNAVLNLTQNAATAYSVEVSNITDGTITAAIVAGAVTDANGNGNQSSTSTDNTVLYDITPPGVTINQAGGQGDPSNAQQIRFAVVFTEAVSGFTASDITLSGTWGVSNAVVSITQNTATDYTVAVGNLATTGTVATTIAAGVVTDAAGYSSTASTSTDNTVTYYKEIIVTKIEDTNDNECSAIDCSLREALSLTNLFTSETPTIHFLTALFNSPQTITLGGELQITKNVIIAGTGANLLTVSGNDAHRVFYVSGATVTINNLTVKNGRGDYTGGIYNYWANLTVNNSIISDSSARNVGFGRYGGGILNNSGTLTLNNSIVRNNSAISDDFSLNAGGVMNTGSGASTTLKASTVSNNTASASGALGGGIMSFDGPFTLINSTVSGNRGLNGASRVGGIYSDRHLYLFDCTITDNEGGATRGAGVYNSFATTIRNTIIADNRNNASFPDIHGGLIISQGYNLIGNPSNTSSWNGTDILNVPPGGARLSPLGNYGGLTPTHALFYNSPARARVPRQTSRKPTSAASLARQTDEPTSVLLSRTSRFRLLRPATAGRELCPMLKPLKTIRSFSRLRV
ncbi:MAG TPA: hypothetical protein VF648_12590 [Pyrinomonadaceae bacterium]